MNEVTTKPDEVIYLAEWQIPLYANPTEPNLYPHGFVKFVPLADLLTAREEIRRWNQLAMNRLHEIKNLNLKSAKTIDALKDELKSEREKLDRYEKALEEISLSEGTGYKAAVIAKQALGGE